ncbi:MAG: hypothetical protein HC905_17130 [Bacteroidales bacterium]|nr:hypothetical protein [Bacteroidales bacterium]
MRDESKILAILERHKKSGLTVNDFCSNEGIARATFYNWKKKLRNNNGKRFIPIEVRNASILAAGANTNPIRQENNLPDECILEIGYPNGVELRVKKDLDLLHLKALINLLD